MAEPDDLLHLDPEFINILDMLKDSEASTIYKIKKDDVHYVLKVVRQPCLPRVDSSPNKRTSSTTTTATSASANQATT